VQSRWTRARDATSEASTDLLQDGGCLTNRIFCHRARVNLPGEGRRRCSEQETPDHQTLAPTSPSSTDGRNWGWTLAIWRTANRVDLELPLEMLKRPLSFPREVPVRPLQQNGLPPRSDFF